MFVFFFFKYQVTFLLMKVLRFLKAYILFSASKPRKQKLSPKYYFIYFYKLTTELPVVVFLHSAVFSLISSQVH